MDKIELGDSMRKNYDNINVRYDSDNIRAALQDGFSGEEVQSMFLDLLNKAETKKGQAGLELLTVLTDRVKEKSKKNNIQYENVTPQPQLAQQTKGYQYQYTNR